MQTSTNKMWVHLSVTKIAYLSPQISAAYVSGMKEDLHLEGNEFNYFQT